MTSAPTSVPRLQARGLVKRSGSTTLLAGVDLDLGGGESLAITGPSGAGTSTLLQCLAGVLRPDEGSVLLRGTEVGHLGERERSLLRRRHYGVVLPFGQLLAELSAVENVALTPVLLGTPRKQAAEHARQWLAALGLAGLEDRRPDELSAGQAQRVAVARALITGPDVVFADEPTGALDRAAGAEVMRVLTDAARAVGASLVVVTRDADVAAWCSRRLEVQDGVVVTDGRDVPVRGAATTAPDPVAASAR